MVALLRVEVADIHRCPGHDSTIECVVLCPRMNDRSLLGSADESCVEWVGQVGEGGKNTHVG